MSIILRPGGGPKLPVPAWLIAILAALALAVVVAFYGGLFWFGSEILEILKGMQSNAGA